ncbi:MAG: glycosyltransferase [Clostridiales bacterium]|nr:glycosyltransferase [Clostridiales bacterium]
MSIYKNTKLDELVECLDSIFNQSVKSDDIVIVFDGPVSSDVETYLDGLVAEHAELNLVKCETNRGLGPALATGMEACKNELIARMDTDDVCAEGRFEAQLAAFEDHPECSVIGGNMSEFTETPDKVCSVRNVPESHDEICAFMKKRCPFNHITVMVKKSDVLEAGGYQSWYCNEDYYLWVRMYLSGCKFYNVQKILSCARVDSMMERRGGKKYYQSECGLFKFMLDNKVITKKEYRRAKRIRFIVQRMMPNRIRQWAFKKFARDKSCKA